MKKKTINSDMPIGKLVRIKDALPSPAQLAVHEETQKITLSLKKSSIKFFKAQASRYHTKYQRMIRQLIDSYATQYAGG
jgi:predicted DNA binding CopG/RHH family protein